MKLKVPSKIILFGEHSIVYPGHKAIITSLGLYTRIKIRKYLPAKFKLNILTNESFNTLIFDLKESNESYNNAFKLYKDFKQSNNIKPLKDFMNTHLGAYKVIIGYIASLINLKGAELDIKIEAPIGSGMGTSASISSGIIKILFEFSGIKLNNQDLFNYTKTIENFQHGNSSGIDPAGVINGYTMQFNHLIDGSRTYEKIKLKEKWDENLFLIYSGKPLESTGEMVNSVKELKVLNNNRMDSIFNQIDSVVNKFNINNLDIASLINQNGLLLENIGVVSDNVINFSKKIRDLGGAVKVCGAGGKKGIASGLLLCKFNDLKKLKEINREFSFSIINTKFNVSGIKLSI